MGEVMTDWVYMVAVKDEWGYLQATKHFFISELIAEKFAKTLAPSRNPIVVQVDARTVNFEGVQS